MELCQIYNLYVADNDATKIYSWGKDFEELSQKQDLYFSFQKLEEVNRIISEDSHCLLKGEEEKGKKNALIGVYRFRIAFYSEKYIANYSVGDHHQHNDTQKVFFQDMFAYRDAANDMDSHFDFSPIIHIVEELTWKDLDDDKTAERFSRIMDGGIWNFLVTSKIDFEKAVRNIQSNWENHYYDLLISQEFADLNARLTLQSYLMEIKSGGHAAAVSPFLFHSEHELKQKREAEAKKNNETLLDIRAYKWRALLVDDRIGKMHLKSLPYDMGVSKEKIIENRIEEILWKGCSCVCVYDIEKYKSTPVLDDEGREPNMVILCVDSIEKAETALKNYKFDFILLDYLLEKHKDKDGKEIERHYGYELLTDLADEENGIGKDCVKDIAPYLHYDEGKRYIVGPDHRYFFMFISAFTTAISERLRLLGYSRSEELWHIAEGACPTNTPELFCYNLQKMMVKRIKDSGMEKLNPDEILKLTEKIFHKAEKGESSVRKRANENYQAILGLLYHYNRILNDVEIPRDEKLIFSIRESVLMTSFMKDHENFGGLLEHLVHLVHLTAFGTARQWSEMWEEYIYVKNQFMDLFNERLDKTITLMIADKEQTILIKEALEKLYNSIEEYILELKRIN